MTAKVAKERYHTSLLVKSQMARILTNTLPTIQMDMDIKRVHHLPLVGATLRELAVQDTLDSSFPHTTRMLSR
jgi:hypothetical protein